MAKDMKIVKRNGTKVSFDKDKIIKAILSANQDVSIDDMISEEVANNIADRIESECSYRERNINVEEIQDIVEKELMREKYFNLAREYIRYRYKQALKRDKYKEMMCVVKEKIEATNVQNQNANVDEKSFGGRVGEMSGAILKQYALENSMSEMAKNNHLNNEIYIHDLDSYSNGMHNCLSIPFDDLLEKGFITRQTDVRPASSINTAFQLVAVIFQLQSLQQFGRLNTAC